MKSHEPRSLAVKDVSAKVQGTGMTAVEEKLKEAAAIRLLGSNKVTREPRIKFGSTVGSPFLPPKTQAYGPKVHEMKRNESTIARAQANECTNGRSNELTVMNASESPTSRENARHSRKGAVCVMFCMKSSQPTVEKLEENVVSKGCGKGVGKTGVVKGTVVSPEVAVEVGPAVDESASEREVPVGVVLSTVETTDDVSGIGSGAGCRL